MIVFNASWTMTMPEEMPTCNFQRNLENSVVDASTLYNGYKDLNEYLCAKIKHSEKAENKKIKGIKL